MVLNNALEKVRSNAACTMANPTIPSNNSIKFQCEHARFPDKFCRWQKATFFPNLKDRKEKPSLQGFPRIQFENFVLTLLLYVFV